MCSLYFSQTAAFSLLTLICVTLLISPGVWIYGTAHSTPTNTISLPRLICSVAFGRETRTCCSLSSLPSPPAWSCLASSFDTHQCRLDDASTRPRLTYGGVATCWCCLLARVCSSLPFKSTLALLRFILQLSLPCPDLHNLQHNLYGMGVNSTSLVVGTSVSRSDN